MTSHSQTETFCISTVQSLVLLSLLTSSHLDCFSLSLFFGAPPPPPHMHTHLSLPSASHSSNDSATTVLTDSSILSSSPLHPSSKGPQTLLLLLLLISLSPSSSPSHSCFMAVDLLLEHLASGPQSTEHTH